MVIIRSTYPLLLMWIGVVLCAISPPGLAQKDASSHAYRFGPFTREIGGLVDPVAVAISDDGSICVAESNGPRISILKSDGTIIKQWGQFGEGPGHLIEPRGIAVTGEEIFVTDSGLHRVTVFDADGKLKRQWGGLGAEPGQFNEPRGITVVGERVFVADAGNNRVQVFDLAGTLQFIAGNRNENGKSVLNRPADVAADSRGTLFVADTGANRIVKFDDKGEFINAWSEWGPFPGLLDEPCAIELSHDRLYVTDRRNHRVQTFDLDGNFIDEWGTHELVPHEGKGRLHYPDSLAIAPSGEFAVIAEAIENRLQRFVRLPEGAPPEPRFIYEKSAQTHFGDHIDIDGKLMTIVEPENHFVFVFDIAAEIPVILNQFGERGEKFGLMLSAAGIELDLDGRTILLSDRGTGRLQQYKLEYDPDAPRRMDPEMTRFSLAWDFDALRASMPDPKPTWPIEPAAIRIDEKGNLYVVDRRNDQVHVFDSAMKFVRSWGKHGGEPGQFRGPTDLSFSKAGDRIFVVDSLNRRVQAFDLLGNHQQAWRIEGTQPDTLAKPFGITSGMDGFVYVTDSTSARVLKFDEQGAFVKQWSETGSKMGQLWKPRGISQDDQLRVFVIDQGNHRAQIFDAEGTWLVTFGAGAAYTRKSKFPNE